MDAAGGCLPFFVFVLGIVHTSASRRDTPPSLFLSLFLSLPLPPNTWIQKQKLIPGLPMWYGTIHTISQPQTPSLDKRASTLSTYSSSTTWTDSITVWTLLFSLVSYPGIRDTVWFGTEYVALESK